MAPFWADSQQFLKVQPWGSDMIRIVALGLAGLAAVTTVGIGASRRADHTNYAEPPAPIVVSPKADRLPVNIDVPAAPVLKTEVSYTVEAEPISVGMSSPPEPPAKQADFIPRHWHDPHAPVLKSQKRAGKKPSKPDAAVETKVAAANCPSEGLQPLLRTLKLSSDCE